MATAAVGGAAGGIDGAGFGRGDWVVGAGVVDEGVGVAAAGQSNDVVGGRVVQPHARSVLVWTGYELGEPPHTHQPGPLAMALQVLSGSAAWEHGTAAAVIAEGDAVGVDDR